jgi:ribosomal protein L23
LFARRVEKVHTINRKAKRTRNRSTGAYNAPARQKRAIVTLAAGEERIDIFGS